MSIEVKRENFMAWMDFFELGVGWIDSVHGCASGCPENENHPPTNANSDNLYTKKYVILLFLRIF